MLIFTSAGTWENVAGDQAFQNNILTIGGSKNDSDKEIRILDANDEVIGLMSRDTIEFQKANFVNANATNLVSVNTKIDYTVNAGESISDIVNSIPRFIREDTAIVVKPGTYTEDIEFKGFLGGAPLYLKLERGVVINGKISMYGCSNIQIIGNGSILNHTAYSTDAIFIKHCNQVSIFNLGIYGRGIPTEEPASLRGIHACDGSSVSIENCTITGFKGASASAITSNYGARVYALDVIGSENDFGYVGTRSGFIGGEGTMPVSKLGNTTLHGGQIIGNFTPLTDVTEEKPAAPTAPLSKTVSYKANLFRFWRTNLAKWQDGVYSSDFGLSTGGGGKSTGENFGCFGFDFSSLRALLQGKQIDNVKIYLQRYTAGGYDVVVNPQICTTTSNLKGGVPPVTKNYGEIGGFKKGEGRTLSITPQIVTDIINNPSIKAIMVCRGDKKQYARWEQTCTITITYRDTPTKSVDMDEDVVISEEQMKEREALILATTK